MSYTDEHAGSTMRTQVDFLKKRIHEVGIERRERTGEDLEVCARGGDLNPDVLCTNMES